LLQFTVSVDTDKVSPFFMEISIVDLSINTCAYPGLLCRVLHSITPTFLLLDESKWWMFHLPLEFCIENCSHKCKVHLGTKLVYFTL
jgi:hypothetical protein